MQPWYFNPVFAEIGPFKLRWYGLMYALAFGICYLYLQYSKQGKALKLSKEQKDTFAAVVIGGVLLGGRLGYILFYNLPYYLQNPLKIVAVWEGGMSFHGGLLAVILGVFWFVRKYRVNFLKLTDIVVSIAPIGLFLGRIGNFINGELYGRIANRFCLYFPTDPVNCRYPSQLLEAATEGLVLFILLFIIRRYTQKTGVASAFFLIFYGIFRIFVEFFREPDLQIGYIFGWLTEGQILSLLMILFGAGLFRILLKKLSSKH
mgnify:CR=1 FL=1